MPREGTRVSPFKKSVKITIIDTWIKCCGCKEEESDIWKGFTEVMTVGFNLEE